MVKRTFFFAVLSSWAAVGTLSSTGCSDSDTTSSTNTQPKPIVEDERGSVGPANPASGYCTKLGYKSEASDCVFPDASRCEQWAFWRAQCGREHSYCVRQGGTIVSEEKDAGSFTTISAICTLNGKQCSEQDFLNSGKCE